MPEWLEVILYVVLFGGFFLLAIGGLQKRGLKATREINAEVVAKQELQIAETKRSIDFQERQVIALERIATALEAKNGK